MIYAFYGAISLIMALPITFMSYKIFQILQQSSYRAGGVVNWLKITKFDWQIRYFACAFFSFVSMLVFVACFGTFKYVNLIGLLFYVAFSLAFVFYTTKQKGKKPLVITKRIVRLIAVSFVLFAGAGFGLLVLGYLSALKYSLIGLLPFFIPCIVLLAHLILVPIEKINNARYKIMATKKLARNSTLVKIGITGSYGKTTAKNILAAMLKAKYRVCSSPQSFNTPMGLSKVINNDLKDDDQVLIAEMGARNKGDIKELCDMIKPQFGLITAIGNQHLETFGSRQAIMDTKFELIQGLSDGGFAAFNGDSPDVIKMFNNANALNLQKITSVLSGGKDIYGANIYYENVKMGIDGTSFTLIMKDGEGADIHKNHIKTEIKTRLLGRHIPSLITLCAAVALKLGVRIEDISEATKELEQVKNRLELIKSGDNIIIDDSYNSNPDGALNALLLLKEFDMTKIIITPGMVELGEEEKASNMALGQNIAACADYCYLVGERAADIRQGAIDGGMGEDRIFTVLSLNEAVQLQGKISGKKVILFENDLPDNIK